MQISGSEVLSKILCFVALILKLEMTDGHLSRERERERDYTYPALRLIQVLPGHPDVDGRSLEALDT